ncbi:hypothetical protein M9Y10_002862 [Tritrichomonas musculus]|uniref:Uncharacterized protein n=1 Tax=Tritrichomonas musculus TaxID=1915356 RepID=A0ABR2LAZ8_9EUKA
MIEVSEDELEAVRNWNCGMLIKKKQRALLCRSFYAWKTSFLNIISYKCVKIQNEIEQKSSVVKKLSFTSHVDSNQSISQLQSSNQQLQKELESLQKKQQELEKATNKIRDTLRTLQSPAAGSSSRTYYGDVKKNVLTSKKYNHFYFFQSFISYFTFLFIEIYNIYYIRFTANFYRNGTKFTTIRKK